MQINDGKYKAVPIKTTVQEVESGAVAVVQVFNVEGGHELIGRSWIVLKDGSIATKTISNLKQCYPGWDGVDPFWLCEQDLSQCEVELVVVNTVYEGKPRVEVKYINPPGGRDLGETMDKAKFMQKFGAKLRANSGGTPVKAPAAPAPQQPLPGFKAPPPPPTPPPALPTGPKSSMEECWNALCTTLTGKERSVIETTWFNTLAKLFPGRNNSDLSPEDWGQVLNAVEDNVQF